MNRDDIIRMADENGIVIVGEAMFRFAALVAAEKDKQIAELQTAISVQAAAVRTYQSTERVQAHEMMELARKLRAESRPDVLESERAANAKLTEELEKAALIAAEKDKQIAFLKDSHDAIRELAYKTGATAEREACAKVCEDTILTTTLADRDYNLGCLDCAKAIRARGQNDTP